MGLKVLRQLNQNHPYQVNLNILGTRLPQVFHHLKLWRNGILGAAPCTRLKEWFYKTVFTKIGYGIVEYLVAVNGLMRKDR